MTRLIELQCIPDPLLGSTGLALAGSVFVNVDTIIMVSGTRRADESVLTLSTGGRIVVRGDAARVAARIGSVADGNDGSDGPSGPHFPAGQ